MLRLPVFELVRPSTLKEAAQLGAQPGSLYIAGGTDMLVNLKHRMHRPERLVSLADVPELHGIETHDDSVSIGACTSLDEVLNHPSSAQWPGLRQALAAIAGPQHRRMGTLGGNVMLDTRCLFVNQTESWRSALGGCLKADGDWCHVIDSPRACIAAQSSDSVPMLTALGARLHFEHAGSSAVPLRDLFTKDGRYDQMLTVPRTALLVRIEIPRAAAKHVSGFRKLRTRQAVDYAQASIAVSGLKEGESIDDLTIVLGAMLPSPRIIDAGSVRLDETGILEIAERVRKAARPQTSIHGSAAWRREALGVEAERLLRSLARG